MSLGRQGGPKKAGRKRFAIATRKAKAARLYLGGKPQHAIARVLGTSQKTVSRDLNAVYQTLEAQPVEDMRTLRARQLARLYERLEQVNAAIARVNERVAKTRQETVPSGGAPGPDGKPVMVTARGVVETAERGGFKGLQEVATQLERLIADIEGNFAPSKRALTDADGNPLGQGETDGFIEDVVVIRRVIGGGPRRD